MRRRRAGSIAANPVLIGAATTLVVVVAVFLAYNANGGLPFVPTFTLRVETTNAGRLVVGNEVREGGERIGQVSSIDPVRMDNGRIGAELTLKLDKTATPVPADSTILIRPRSSLGLKFVDLRRGSSGRALRDNSVIATSGTGTVAPELDDVFGMFDPPTREAIRQNLTIYGGALAGRGADLNRALAALPQLLSDAVPVLRTLSDPSTRLRPFVRELADAARITAPVSTALAHGFTVGANTFEALSRDPQALEQTIAESPATLQTGIDSLPVQRPLYQALAGIAGDLTGTARELRASAPLISRALATGTDVLPETPPLSADLGRTLSSLRTLAADPTTNLTLDGLRSTAATLDPTLRYLGPHVTVCNYWNYFWTFLSDHLAERVSSGTVQRIEVKTVPMQANSPMMYGATRPADGTGAIGGDAVALHAQPYGRAVDAQGNADCEHGQRGYPKRLAEGAPPDLNIAVDARTPGDQGPTYTGKPRVPAGETFSAEPTGLAPKVTP